MYERGAGQSPAGARRGELPGVSPDNPHLRLGALRELIHARTIRTAPTPWPTAQQIQADHARAWRRGGDSNP